MSLLTLLLFFQLFASLPPDVSPSDIPRFQMIADGLYRGGQPDRDGFEYLKKSGFKTVINLRTGNDEEAIVRELGMNYVHIPISIKFWSKIPDRAIEAYFKILNDPANYPIFFHCRRGADRTGAMAGFYRISVQGWEAKKAYSEARNIGMRWWFPGLKKQLYAFTPTAQNLPPLAEIVPIPTN
jgi:protein tyrosine/serine phosphatase